MVNHLAPVHVTWARSAITTAVAVIGAAAANENNGRVTCLRNVLTEILFCGEGQHISSTLAFRKPYHSQRLADCQGYKR
jgi:hypothetical protein